MSVTELQEKRGRLMTQAREALDEIKKNTDEARAAELDKRHDDIMAEFDKIERTIEREQKMADVEARFAARQEEERARPRERFRHGDIIGTSSPSRRRRSSDVSPEPAQQTAERRRTAC